MATKILADDAAFSAARSSHQAAVTELQNSCKKQQKVFDKLGSGWKGKGGDAFRNCTAEIIAEACMGIVALTAVGTQASNAQAKIKEVDQALQAALTQSSSTKKT